MRDAAVIFGLCHGRFDHQAELVVFIVVVVVMASLGARIFPAGRFP